ncbi:hypothetical protein V2J09_003006 [Rumex salicifolius]
MKERAAEKGITLEWVEKGARFGTSPRAGIKIDKSGPDEDRRVWFNSLMSAYASQLADVTLADGAPGPPKLIEECVAILEEECGAVPWRHGDVLMLDNQAVQHARRPKTTKN